jgi:hypothetical protein
MMDDMAAKVQHYLRVKGRASAGKDRRTKFSIYEREGVNYYCIVDPVDNVVKVFSLREGKYIKQMDATEETFEIDLGKCRIVFEFARIWPA